MDFSISWAGQKWIVRLVSQSVPRGEPVENGFLPSDAARSRATTRSRRALWLVACLTCPSHPEPRLGFQPLRLILTTDPRSDFGATGAGRAQPFAWSAVGTDRLHVELAAGTAALAAASQRQLSRSLDEAGGALTSTSWLVARAGWRRLEEVSSTSSNPFPPQVCRVHSRPERLPHRGHDPRLAEGRRDRIRGALFAPRLFACFASCFDRRALVPDCLAFRFRAVGA